MRGNRKAILVDIHEKNLDPRVAHKKLDDKGRLQSRQQSHKHLKETSKKVEVKQVEIVEIKDEPLNQTTDELVQVKEESPLPETISDTTEKAIPVIPESQEVFETRLEDKSKNQKKKKKSNQD